MKKISSNIAIFLLAAMLMLGACMEREEYPPEPIIQFKAFYKLVDGSGIDNRGILEFTYTDGDGDIGLYDYDTIPPYDYNLFVKYYEQQNGVFKEVFLTYEDPFTGDIDTVNLNARIPILTPTGKNKAIKGTIQDTLFINNYESHYDTVKFEVYIKDRALNESNTIETPPIIIDKEP